MTNVTTDWRTARAAAAYALAVALEDALEHISNVEEALETGNDTAGNTPDPIITAGHAYGALLRSKVTELRAEADGLTA